MSFAELKQVRLKECISPGRQLGLWIKRSLDMVETRGMLVSRWSVAEVCGNWDMIWFGLPGLTLSN